MKTEYIRLYRRVFWRRFWGYTRDFFKDEHGENFPSFHTVLSSAMLVIAAVFCVAGHLWLGITGIIVVALPLLANLGVLVQNSYQRASQAAFDAVRAEMRRQHIEHKTTEQPFPSRQF